METTGRIMKAPALANIDENLHHLFVPQLETLQMEPRARRCGVVSQLDPARGSGSAWMTGLGRDCLVTVLDLTVSDGSSLTSCGPGYFCLGSMSPSSLETMPCPTFPTDASDLVMYRQGAGSYSYQLKPGCAYASRSLCFTPRFIEQVARDQGTGADELLERLTESSLPLRAPHVSAMLNRLDARSANAPATGFRLAALMAEAVACLIETTEGAAWAARAEGTRTAAQLIHKAHAIMEQHLDAPLTLDSIARELCVSRTRLAAVYKEETGRGVAEDLRQLRMNRASDLLAGTDMPLAEIGRAVGYPRPSSFTTAFTREQGCSPAAWRKRFRC